MGIRGFRMWSDPLFHRTTNPTRCPSSIVDGVATAPSQTTEAHRLACFLHPPTNPRRLDATCLLDRRRIQRVRKPAVVGCVKVLRQPALIRAATCDFSPKAGATFVQVSKRYNHEHQIEMVCPFRNDDRHDCVGKIRQHASRAPCGRICNPDGHASWGRGAQLPLMIIVNREQALHGSRRPLLNTMLLAARRSRPPHLGRGGLID